MNPVENPVETTSKPMGALIVDKPRGWTSHDVVNKVRRIVGERSVGHLGTLDPLATGVLPLLIGPATRLAKFYGQATKVYEACVRFGFATDTYDADGEQSGEPMQVQLDRDSIECALGSFRGVIQQTPPRFSAKKIAGVPAYQLARDNKDVHLAAVEVEVYSLELLGIDRDHATLRVQCSSGTYVRSLAHDLGIALGYGAHLTELRRTRSGDFDISEAHSLKALESLKAEARLGDALLRAETLLPHFPSIETDAVTAAQIHHGRDFRTSPFLINPSAKHVRALTSDGALLAIGEMVAPHVYHPVVVLG